MSPVAYEIITTYSATYYKRLLAVRGHLALTVGRQFLSFPEQPSWNIHTVCLSSMLDRTVSVQCRPSNEEEVLLACDDNIKVLKPVLILLTPHTPAQQEVHDNMRVVPQRVCGYKQLLASCPVHVHNSSKAFVFVYVLSWVLGNCLLQAPISMT